LLADQLLQIHQDDDSAARGKIQTLAPDILIDLDAYGPLERLPVFAAVKAPYKFLWGEAPLPPLLPDTRVLAGARLGLREILPVVALPEMGECLDLPDLPIYSVSTPATTPAEARFGCLTPAARIGREGWALFAGILNQHPQSRLVLNLQDLGDEAQAFIGDQFSRQGVAPERLDFVHARIPEELCRYWRDIDLGLAPPVDSGDLALPTCLWMGKPYLALASPLPWSRRPAALLEAVAAVEWVAATPEAYVALAGRPRAAPNPDFRARLQAIGLTDPVAFAQGFADAFSFLSREVQP
jgi:predicted O-linked N-acetylglucosamine transferase (SPINDLY family)